jgi:hypothetical protein
VLGKLSIRGLAARIGDDIKAQDQAAANYEDILLGDQRSHAEVKIDFRLAATVEWGYPLFFVGES